MTRTDRFVSKPGKIPAALERLVRDGPFAAIMTDLHLRVIEVADVWGQETGRSRETMIGRGVASIFPADAVADLMRRSLAGERTCSTPVEVGAGGMHKLYRLESGPWLDDDRELGGLLIFGRDITTIVDSRAEIERSERRLKMALEIDRTLVWEKNLTTGEMYTAGSLIDILPELKTTADPLTVVHPDDRKRVETAWRRHVSEGAPFEIEFRHVGADGTEIWLRNVQKLVRGDDGKPQFILGVSKDISHRREAEAEIQRLAFRDTLTGLCNRTLFQQKFNEAVENAARVGGGVGLIIVDVDHFKDVNDTFGHDTGDALLREMADLLSRAFRNSDTVARLGGDEFAVVLPGVDTAQALLRPVEILFNLLRTPIDHGGATFTIGASIGAALLSDGEDGAQLLKNADIALYEAKYAGRNRVVRFEQSMRASVENRIEVLREVRAGIKANQFVLYYQPVIDMEEHGVAGFEALMRWNHPERGVLTPEHFAGAFEDQELSLKLGEIAFDRALSQMRSWMEQGLEFGRVAINVSPAQFRNRLAETVAAKLKHWGVPADKLTIEITENVYMGWSSNVVSNTIKELHASGVLIALDDFGTGYASLANLRQFPIDRLKIDRSFVQNPEDDAIVRAVIGLGSSMGMKVIAEGVEHYDQLLNLKQYGCDQVQGYHFSRPMPALEVPRFLRQFAVGVQVSKTA